MKQSLLVAVACVVSVFAARPAAAATSLTKCVKITKPGVYIVTKAITAPAGFSACFLIAIDNVTIDFGGYTVTGQADGHGVLTDGERKNITLRNGGLRNFLDGIVLQGSQFQIDHINSSNNVYSGMYMHTGQAAFVMSAIVSNSVTSDNGLSGIFVQQTGVLLVNNVAHNNLQYGIYAYDLANLVGNIAVNNTQGNIVVGDSSTRYQNNPFP